MSDLTVIYYTSNYLEKKNPYFVANTKKQLLKAIGDIPLISVSQEPMDFGKNICLGIIGRSHLNIYRQILEGCKAATTKFVALAEDDILYSPEHFDFRRYIKNPREDTFYYDMCKLSIFTWIRPALFSFRFKREVVNQLIAPRQLLIDALEERFRRVEVLIKKIKIEHPEITDPEQRIIKYWGDLGRYEDILGVTVRKTRQESCTNPSIVFSHEYAFGYEVNQGKKKRLGDLRIHSVPYWGSAEEVLKLFYK
jgi:hypothetical protein